MKRFAGKLYSKNGPRHSTAALKPVLMLGKIIGIIPLDNKSVVASHLYSILLAAIVCYFYGCSVLAKASKKIFEPSVEFMDAFHDGIVVVFVVWTLLYINIRKFRRYFKFHDGLQVLDEYLMHVNNKPDRSRLIMYLDILFWHVVYILLVWHHAYVWCTFDGWTYSGPYFFRQYLYYFILVSALITRNYVTCIKYRFEVLGEALSEVNANLFDQLMTIRYQNERNYGLNVANLHRIYTRLTSVAANYNAVYGWMVIMISMLTFTSILLSIKTWLVYKSGKVLLLGHRLNNELVLMCIVLVSMPILLMRSIYKASRQAAIAAHNIPMITYEVTHNISPQLGRDELRETLGRLALESSITAPDFWTGRYGVLYLLTEMILFLCICSYPIVVMNQLEYMAFTIL